MADYPSDARTFQARVYLFDERLRESGHADVADLLRDLLAEHARLRAALAAAVHRATTEYEQRIEVQARLDLFKHQLSVQEARTESWHHAYDALHAQLEKACNVLATVIEDLHARHRPQFSVTVSQCAAVICRRATVVLASAPPAAPGHDEGGSVG